MKKQNKRILAIQELYHEHVIISQPVYLGKDHQVYIAETKQGKTVFRFSSKECALKNLYLSKILQNHNIPVPDVTVCRIDGEYCEIYPFIEGKTLYERHQEGMSSETIKKIYTQLCDICYRISQIPTKEVEKLNLHTCKTDLFFKLLNNSPRVIGHCDLSDKNILLDNNDNVCAIIDLDEVYLKTFELILIHLFETAQEKGYGYTVENIKDFLPEMYHKKVFLNISKQYEIYKKLVNIKSKFHILQNKTK